MSFELFIWLNEAWATTGQRFKNRESAEAAGKSMVIEGLTTMYSPDFDIRESSEEPNVPSQPSGS